MNYNFFTKLHRQSKGFTLVETLVAISIFTVSILALMVVLTKSISDTNYAKQKIIAGYLAQEGVEYMRNLRDTYVLYEATGQAGWDTFVSRLAGASCDTSGCYFDSQNIDYTSSLQPMTSLDLYACDVTSCPVLAYDSLSGTYGYMPGPNSGFVRKINVVQSANQIRIVSTVYWEQNSGTYNISMSETLFNWVE